MRSYLGINAATARKVRPDARPVSRRSWCSALMLACCCLQATTVYGQESKRLPTADVPYIINACFKLARKQPMYREADLLEALDKSGAIPVQPEELREFLFATFMLYSPDALAELDRREILSGDLVDTAIVERLLTKLRVIEELRTSFREGVRKTIPNGYRPQFYWIDRERREVLVVPSVLEEGTICRFFGLPKSAFETALDIEVSASNQSRTSYGWSGEFRLTQSLAWRSVLRVDHFSEPARISNNAPGYMFSIIHDRHVP